VSAELTAQEPSAKYLVNLQPPLVRHFDLIAQAPGGVARLRELILTLAVQGKLVPQDPSDEPASELLKKIALEKDRLVGEKKIRKGKPLPDIGDEEMFFELPRSWAWVRLNSIGDWGAGATPSRTNSNYYGGKIPWFKSGELTADHITESEETVTEAALRECSLRMNQPGDVLIAMYGATIGKTAILDVVGTTNQAVCACTPFSGMSNSYLLLLMKALKPYFISQGAGGAQPNISREKIIHTVIGLPPLAEQSRIVTRVEELMQLCDALEASGQLEAQQHAQLAGTLLGTLTQSETPEALTDNWQRIATHFDVLLDRPEAVDALEQTILQLAVRGLLVPQDPTDEPASVLLQKIRTEKDHLIAQGKIKRDKPLPPITDEEQPFELPQVWEWVRMGSVVNASEAGWSPTCIGSPRTVGKWGVLKVSAVSWGEFDAMANKELPADLVPRPEYEVMDGDFLLSRANTAELVARSVVVKKAEPRLMLSDKIIRLDVSRLMSRDFLNLCNNAEVARNHYVVNTSGTSSSMKNVSREVVLATPIPLPPLAEQSRIVARVNELRNLCADLRRQIVKARAVVENLSKSLVAEV
jgi:type I restriction enzyme, S subunit